MIVFDLNTRMVEVEGKPQKMGRWQFEICLFLAMRPGWVRSRDRIMDHVYGPDANSRNDRSVDTHLRRARKIIGHDAIESHYGVGWAWVAPVEIRREDEDGNPEKAYLSN